jgi:hypothetical protein
MTTRDKKGRFARPCKLKDFKIGVKNWWSAWGADVKTICIVLFALWVIITGMVWIFGSKEVESCSNRTSMQQTSPSHYEGKNCNDTRVYFSGYGYYSFFDNNDPENCTLIMPKYGYVEERTCYMDTVYGQNTLVDSVIIEGNWIKDTSWWIATKKVV